MEFPTKPDNMSHRAYKKAKRSHQKELSQGLNLTLPCFICQEIFNSSSSFIIHLKTNHNFNSTTSSYDWKSDHRILKQLAKRRNDIRGSDTMISSCNREIGK